MTVLFSMFFSLFLSLLLLLCPGVLQASCDLYREGIRDVGLKDNGEFWEAVARLESRENVTDNDRQRLLEQFKKANTRSSPSSASSSVSAANPNLRAQSPSAVSAGSTHVRLRRQAEHGYENLPPAHQRRVDQFVELFSQKGEAAVHDLRGQRSWHYEYIDQKQAYSVRIDGGTRLLFTHQEGRVEILDISKQAYRH